MGEYHITGGSKLSGELAIGGCKNAVCRNGKYQANSSNHKNALITPFLQATKSIEKYV